MNKDAAKTTKVDPPGDSRLVQLDEIFAGQKKLLIVIHNNPDPDALASALALRYLVEERHGLKASIAYGGLIGRAENQALVREVNIPLKNVNRVRFASYDRIALLDTQPGAGNNSLPADVTCHLVIDHHPRRRRLKAEVLLIEPDIGASATLLVELLELSKLTVPANLATALAYAIRSETQELGREAESRDVRAYFQVCHKASMKKLSRITHPKLPHSYFDTLAKALRKTHVFRHLICSHLGEIPIPEIVAETADFLLRRERISWAFCSGRFQDDLILSLRSSNARANAGRIIRQLVPESQNAGGHDMIAGGKISLRDLDEADIEELEGKLSYQFAKRLGYEKADWKPLLEEEEG